MDEIWGNTGIKMIVVQEICLLAKKYNVEKVVLFGSRARGDYRRVSDIDLGFTGEIFADLRWMWMRRLVIRLLIQMNILQIFKSGTKILILFHIKLSPPSQWNPLIPPAPSRQDPQYHTLTA
jgi:hypothetical protein